MILQYKNVISIKSSLQSCDLIILFNKPSSPVIYMEISHI